jgi:hypothetical protein
MRQVMRCVGNTPLTARALWMLAVCVLLASACKREAARSKSFVESLRCGMTPAEVTRLARDDGYNGSDRSWLTRKMSSMKSKELSLVDLTFRGGRLVGFKEGRYVPGTRRIEYRSVNLCQAGHP